jgi:tetratricopeptide (TPR) repeat protein
MSEFGDLLRIYRRKCRDPTSEGVLTQARLAELLGIALGVEKYLGAAVSNWERGLNQIRRDDRRSLVALVTVLHKCSGIQTQAEADQLLLAGNYRPLDETELAQINPDWKRIKSTKPGDPALLSAEEQEAMLQSPSYSRLFGLEGAIDHLLMRLLAPKAPHLFVIVGLGGMGKTALADAVARRSIYTGSFARVIWFSTELAQEESQANQASASIFRTVIEALAQQISPEKFSDPNPVRKMARVRSELKRRRYLVVIDNLEDATEMNWLLGQLNNLTEPSKFLLTARHHPAAGINAYTFPMKELTAGDAAALLRHQAETGGVDVFTQITDEEVAEVYRVIGGHPLALRLIPRLAGMYPLSEILAGWQEEQAGYIAQAYDVIYDSLWQALKPAEKQLLQVTPLIAQVGATVRPLQVITGLPRTNFQSALTKLIELCLIEPRGTLQEQRYGIHSLTRRFLQSQREQAGETAAASWAKSIEANIVYWSTHLNQLPDKQWHTLDIERFNIFRAIHFTLSLPEEAVDATLKDHWRKLSELLFRFVERRGYGHEWIPLMERLVEKFEADSHEQCQLLNRLGELYRLTQQLVKATETHQKALQIAQQAEDELEVARAHFNLGTDHYRRGELDVAVHHGQTALEIFTRLGLSGRETAAALNLSGLVAKAQGNFNLAETCLRQAVSIWQQLDQPPEQARTLNNLALTLTEQEKVEEALQCYAEARVVLARTASELDRILVYLSEGTLYFNLERYAEAEATFQRINLAFLREAGHLLYQALALNNLGNVALVQEEYGRAEKHLRECVLLWQQIGDEIEVADTLGVLGDVMAAMDRVDEAISLYEEALALLSRHPDDSRATQPAQKIRQRLENLRGQKKRD